MFTRISFLLSTTLRLIYIRTIFSQTRFIIVRKRKIFPSAHPVHVMYTIEHFTFGMGIRRFFSLVTWALVPTIYYWRKRCETIIMFASIMFRGRCRAKRTREHIVVHRNAEKLNEQLVSNNINEPNENRSYIKM